jgi:RNA polymerase sigma-70 factor (ECF subfamily)
MEQRLISELSSHRQKLLNYLRKRLSDNHIAEDVLQDALLKALRSAHDLNDQEKLLPWFYRILQNTITDMHRRSASRPTEVKDPQTVLSNLAAPDSTDEATICSCFVALLPSLKPEYAELINRLDLSGESPEKVAGDLKISGNNLKVRHHRARQALKRRLEEACRLCAKHHCLDCTCAGE